MKLTEAISKMAMEKTGGLLGATAVLAGAGGLLGGLKADKLNKVDSDTLRNHYELDPEANLVARNAGRGAAGTIGGAIAGNVAGGLAVIPSVVKTTKQLVKDQNSLNNTLFARNYSSRLSGLTENYGTKMVALSAIPALATIVGGIVGSMMMTNKYSKGQATAIGKEAAGLGRMNRMYKSLLSKSLDGKGAATKAMSNLSDYGVLKSNRGYLKRSHEGLANAYNAQREKVIKGQPRRLRGTGAIDGIRPGGFIDRI